MELKIIDKHALSFSNLTQQTNHKDISIHYTNKDPECIYTFFINGVEMEYNNHIITIPKFTNEVDYVTINVEISHMRTGKKITLSTDRLPYREIPIIGPFIEEGFPYVFRALFEETERFRKEVSEKLADYERRVIEKETEGDIL